MQVLFPVLPAYLYLHTYKMRTCSIRTKTWCVNIDKYVKHTVQSRNVAHADNCIIHQGNSMLAEKEPLWFKNYYLSKSITTALTVMVHNTHKQHLQSRRMPIIVPRGYDNHSLMLLGPNMASPETAYVAPKLAGDSEAVSTYNNCHFI